VTLKSGNKIRPGSHSDYSQPRDRQTTEAGDEDQRSEMQADGRKATFFYIADGRVDFRELIKVYAGEFKLKVEMRQIGARQESAKVGGIGSCGRDFVVPTWLTDFKSVTLQQLVTRIFRSIKQNSADSAAD
jgi:hypothetical protein